MGYLSNIAIVFSKEGYNTFLDIVRKDYPTHVRNTIEDFMDKCIIKKEDTLSGAKAFYWRNVKWDRFANNVPDVNVISSLINSSLKKIDMNHFHFVDIGELDDDNYTVGYYFDNPFGIGIRRTITGIEEGNELDYVLMTRMLNHRNVRAIRDFASGNISPEAIHYSLKNEKDIKQNICKIIFTFIFYTQTENYIDDVFTDKLIDFCIEIMNDKCTYTLDRAYKYEISELVVPMSMFGVYGLLFKENHKDNLIIASIMYGICNTLIFGSSHSVHRNKFSGISDCIRRLSIC